MDFSRLPLEMMATLSDHQNQYHPSRGEEYVTRLFFRSFVMVRQRVLGM